MAKVTRPTRCEYRGVVFRSKSEAVFARAMDLNGHTGGRWMYEPCCHSHPWDFEVAVPFQDSCSLCGHDVVSFRRVLIEYKPSEPTRTYIAELTEKVRPSVEKCCRKNGGHVLDSYIVWGNPWTGPVRQGLCSYICYPIFSDYDPEYGWGDFIQQCDNGESFPFSCRHDIRDVLGIDETMAQKARQFRFDLKHATH